ncbi:hypothetical protein [Streptomyces wedmorensis]
MTQPPYRPPQHPPGHYYGPYGPPPKKPMGAGAIVAIVIGSLVGAIVLIGVLNAAFGDDKAKPRATPTTRPATSAPTLKAVEKTSPLATKPAGYADGDYIIGEDIPPGTYQTPGAQAGAFEFCMVSTKPTADSVMPQLKSANKDERIIITIKAEDGVLSISGCEPLTRRK